MSFSTKNQYLSLQDFESLLLSESKFNSSEDFCHYAANHSWIINHSDLPEILSTIKRNYPDKLKAIVGRAEMITENCFDILGSGPTFLGSKINWHLDFKSGRIWKKDYFLSVPQIHWSDKSDAKVPWELSRFQYLSDLAVAYSISGIHKYLTKFIALIEDWIYENPCPYGINWTNPMEVSIRAINWLTAYELINKQDISISFQEKFLNLLYQHGVYIWENIASFGPGINNNHYLYDLTGLLVMGRLFYNLSAGREWYDFARGELEKEIFNQISPDGTCYESSLNYQIVMLELYLFAINFEHHQGHDFSEELKARLMQSCAALYLLSKPDQTVPNFGDSGSDALLKFEGREERNICHILDLASVVIDLKGYTPPRVRPEIDVLYLTGSAGMNKYFNNLVNRRRQKKSYYFVDSGLAVCRSGENYLGFFANAASEIGVAGHKHNDILALEFSHGKDNFIVDSGTYVYTGDPAGRNYFRKTSSHSTMEVDGLEINRFLPKILFSIRRDAEVREVSWESNNEFDSISAEHSGYIRLEKPVLIKRNLHFDKADGIYLVKDQFMGSGEHQLSGNLILDSDIKAAITDSHALLMAPSGKIAVIVMADPDWSLEKIPHFISKKYGQKFESWKIRYFRTARVPQTCMWGLFAVESYEQIPDKLNKFYDKLSRLNWKPEKFGKLVLKRGSEIVLNTRLLEKMFTPGLNQLRRETEMIS